MYAFLILFSKVTTIDYNAAGQIRQRKLSRAYSLGAIFLFSETSGNLQKSSGNLQESSGNLQKSSGNLQK